MMVNYFHDSFASSGWMSSRLDVAWGINSIGRHSIVPTALSFFWDVLLAVCDVLRKPVVRTEPSWRRSPWTRWISKLFVIKVCWRQLSVAFDHGAHTKCQMSAVPAFFFFFLLTFRLKVDAKCRSIAFTVSPASHMSSLRAVNNI